MENLETVSNSVINGQWKQAVEQFIEFNFDLYEIRSLEISHDDKLKLLYLIIETLKK